MRLIRLAVVLAALSVPLFVTSSASALDLCEEPHCQPPPAEQNTPYEFEFEAEEGCLPYFFKYISGRLPAGLVVTSDGELEGTPTEAGTFEFWVALDDNGGPNNPACPIKGTQSQARFRLVVLPDLAVTTTSLPVAVPAQPYSFQLEFSNPELGWPVVWDIPAGSLPVGLTLSASGLISGTPTGPDSKTFTVRAREPFRRFGERQLTLTVATALQATSAARVGEVGVRYSGAIRASGGLAPRTFSVASGSLPGGLTLNPSTGAITGTPSSAGSFPVTVAVADAGGQRVTVNASIRIAQRVAIATRRLPLASVGAAYRARLATSGGVAPSRWRIVSGALPRGIKLDRRTGALSGVARQSGTFRIVVQVTDRLGATSRKSLTLRVTS